MSTARKSSTSAVTMAAKWPAQTTTFLTKLNTALSIFDDEISSLGEQRTTAYETFITAYQTAFTDIWPKIQTANVTTLLSSVTDTELRALKRLSEQLCPDPKPTLIKEKRDVPTSHDILGGLISRIPEQKLPGKEACSLIGDIFSDLAEAHKFYARAAKGLADIADLVSPEQLTVILAAVVPPTLQLLMLPGFSTNYAKSFLPVSLFLGYSVAACICCPKCALVLGNGSERFCTWRPLLGSYVHQESMLNKM